VTRYIICDETTLDRAVVLSANGSLVDADADHLPKLFKTFEQAESERQKMQAKSQTMFQYTIKPIEFIGYPL
jgi:hypothetical protein